MLLRRYHEQEKKKDQPVEQKPADTVIPAEKPKRGRRKKDDAQ